MSARIPEIGGKMHDLSDVVKYAEGVERGELALREIDARLAEAKTVLAAAQRAVAAAEEERRSAAGWLYAQRASLERASRSLADAVRRAQDQRPWAPTEAEVREVVDKVRGETARPWDEP